MEDTAEIIVHERELLPGRMSRTYEWRGLSSWPVLIHGNTLSRLMEQPFKGNGYPEIVDCFPWKLRLIDEAAYHLNGAYYVRTDSGMWAYLWMMVRANRMIQTLKQRIILTLMVWGLAYVEPGELISWRCVGRKWPY